MTSMIERVAQAIEQGVCGRCGRAAPEGITPQDCDLAGCFWQPATPDQKARAAIEAMREPSGEMVAQAAVYEENKRVLRLSAPHDGMWRAMISAALKEQP